VWFLNVSGTRVQLTIKKGPKPLVMRAANLLIYLLACCLPCPNACDDELAELRNYDTALNN